MIRLNPIVLLWQSPKMLTNRRSSAWMSVVSVPFNAIVFLLLPSWIYPRANSKSTSAISATVWGRHSGATLRVIWGDQVIQLLYKQVILAQIATITPLRHGTLAQW
jgi:hypothetical protein